MTGNLQSKRYATIIHDPVELRFKGSATYVRRSVEHRDLCEMLDDFTVSTLVISAILSLTCCADNFTLLCLFIIQLCGG